MQKDVDFAVVDYLSDLPQAAAHGLCVACDLRGIPDPATGKRYAYIAQPTSPTAFMLLRTDLGGKAIRQLEAPPAAPAGTYLTDILAILYDPNGGPASNTPTIYVIGALSAAPWMFFYSYTIRTGVWLARANIAGLAAALGGAGGAAPNGISLAHTCNTLGIVNDASGFMIEDVIWANGDGGVLGGAGVSNLARYSKAGNVWALVTGAGGARGAAPGLGSQLAWLPTQPNVLFSNRGGASGLIDRYTPATNAWGAVATVPLMVLDEGTDWTTLYEAPGRIAVRPGNPGESIHVLDPYSGAVETLAQIEGVDGQPHRGNAMCAWFVSGRYYLGIVRHSNSDMQRIELVVPV